MSSNANKLQSGDPLESNDGASSPRLRLRITAAAERAVRAGHPWVFADSIRRQNREGRSGELAVMYDRQDRFLAAGLYDPVSPIRVRILHAGKPQTIDRDWWAARLEAALQRRRGLFDANTTGYRMIHGESDGWPGLVLDRYGATLVLKLYTAAWLPRLEMLTNLCTEQLHPSRIVLRLSRNVREAAAKSDGEILCGEPVGGPVEFLESGIRFEADVLRGQKTGFFLDQRDNRRRVEALARGRRVLNAFSFSGGFSVYAARGGAISATDLDISGHALAGARRVFDLNSSNRSIAACRHRPVQADAFDWLESQSRRQFDLAVLDPPSFAKREAERPAAIRAYEKLADLAVRGLTANGVLVSCSCSAHVTAVEFFDAVKRGIVRSKRRFEELQTTGHAPDHPATFKEAGYLKAIYLKVI